MRLDCPWPEHSDAWIEVPDEWLGSHSTTFHHAIETADKLALVGLVRRFAISVPMLVNYHFPKLGGNFDAWDWDDPPTKLMAWVVAKTLGSYEACFIIPKVSSSPSLNGLTAEAVAPGTSERETAL